MPGLDDQCEGARPSELEWEPNGIHEPIRLLVGQVHRVVAQHGRHHVAERTPRVGVDDGLVVLQADAKPRLARSYAFARLGVRPTAAADAGIVPAPVVAERFETELEDAGTVCLLHCDSQDQEANPQSDNVCN